MVNTMHQEMQGQEHRRVGQPLIDVEEEPMQGVLEERPDDVADKETY